MPLGSVEIALPANGDFSLQSNGDLVLSIDTATNPQATIERLTRLILTNPRAFDANGAPISIPDDPFNPSYGSGSRALVGEMQTPALANAIRSHILGAIATDATIAAIPAPVVTVTPQPSLASVAVSIVCYAVTGEVLTIPTLSLPLGS